MSRLNIERQRALEPERIDNAIKSIEDLGIPVQYEDKTKIGFIFKRYMVWFFPYSGWHTGKSIKDGRGLQNLLNQLQ
jgi:hypothetical protein